MQTITADRAPALLTIPGCAACLRRNLGPDQMSGGEGDGLVDPGDASAVPCAAADSSARTPHSSPTPWAACARPGGVRQHLSPTYGLRISISPVPRHACAASGRAFHHAKSSALQAETGAPPCSSRVTRQRRCTPRRDRALRARRPQVRRRRQGGRSRSASDAGHQTSGTVRMASRTRAHPEVSVPAWTPARIRVITTKTVTSASFFLSVHGVGYLDLVAHEPKNRPRE